VTERVLCTDDELRQRLYSQTDEFCEALQTLVDMHQSQLSSLPAAAAADCQSADSAALMMTMPAGLHYPSNVSTQYLYTGLSLTELVYCVLM